MNDDSDETNSLKIWQHCHDITKNNAKSAEQTVPKRRVSTLVTRNSKKIREDPERKHAHLALDRTFRLKEEECNISSDRFSGVGFCCVNKLGGDGLELLAQILTGHGQFGEETRNKQIISIREGTRV